MVSTLTQTVPTWWQTAGQSARRARGPQTYSVQCPICFHAVIRRHDVPHRTITRPTVAATSTLLPPPSHHHTTVLTYRLAAGFALTHCTSRSVRHSRPPQRFSLPDVFALQTKASPSKTLPFLMLFVHHAIVCSTSAWIPESLLTLSVARLRDSSERTRSSSLKHTLSAKLFAHITTLRPWP